MTELTLVYSFRNRALDRVKESIKSLVAQSYKNFEVIFIDYGSDTEIAAAAKKMLAEYPFVKYIFNNTLGMPWSRSHALNTGIRLAVTPYVMTMDTDILLSENYLEKFISKRGANKVIYSNVYLLPEGHPYYAGQKDFSGFKIQSGGAGLGLYPAAKLMELGGYDEY